MNAKDAIRSSANLSSMVITSYIGDLEDADLMRRPTAGCNHLAWQLGHLIASEVQLLEGAAPGKGIELPAGFAAAHSKEKATDDNPSDFLSKAEYLELFDKVRANSLAALDAFPESELDNPAPESLRAFCPTMGEVFNLIADHPLMHAGQFVIVRRQLGKPIVI
jgi:hypothetical protein